MNIFRLVGDLTHLFSIVMLLYRIVATRSCAGISFYSQLLYAIVFTARYIDLFFVYISLYNSVMKMFFLSSAYAIVILMRHSATLRGTYVKHTRSHDTFRIFRYLVLPCMGLAIIFPHRYHLFDMIWSFSIYLEAVAILPQLFVLQRMGEVESLTSHYVFSLGGYRAAYVLNWIYRYATEGRLSLVAFLAGMVQTGLYADFFYHYYNTVMKGKKMTLPN